MRRIDALGLQYQERYRVLDGSVLDRSLDQALQALVTRAARELSMPMALVSIVLERTQFFRAHFGLPPDLCVAQATDRDASFCQFVVRDGERFEVHNAPEDERVPQDLVELYGIRAYLGEPVRIRDAVVGSLCVIGTEPKHFTNAERGALFGLASQVSARLEELTSRQRTISQGLVALAAKPAFGGASNVLTALTMSARAARIAALDASPMSRLVRDLPQQLAGTWPALSALTHAAGAADMFVTLTRDIDECAQDLVKVFGALQNLIAISCSGLCVFELVEVASKIAFHHTKLIGGAHFPEVSPLLRVSTPRMVAISLLSCALSVLSDAMTSARSGIQGTVDAVGDDIRIDLRTEALSEERLSGCLTVLRALIDEASHVAVSAAEGVLSLRFSAASSAFVSPAKL